MFDKSDFVKSELKLNGFQLRISICLRFLKKLTCVAGRGIGKTSVLAMLIHLIVKTMPRSTWAIQGASFQQILTRTLPGTLAFLEKLGYYKDVHYVLNEKPPKSWKILPFYIPGDYKHYITFFNKDGCVGFVLFSQEREGSSRGPSVDGIINDESLTLDADRFFSEAKLTNRGNDEIFGHLPYHHGVFNFTSMPHGNTGKWLLKDGDYYAEEDKYFFRVLMNELIDLQVEFLKENDPIIKEEIWKLIDKKKPEVSFYPSKKGVFYIEGNAFENVKNVGLRYIQETFDDAPDKLLFMVEMLNKLVETITDTFYLGFDRHKLGYKGDYNYSYLDAVNIEDIGGVDSRQDNDCVSNHKLQIGLDFGSKINWCIVAQHFEAIDTLRVLKNFYVKSPKIIDDMARDFCTYYRHHKHKVVHVWPDAQGNDEVANSKMKYTDQFCAILKDNGWTVIVKGTHKKNPMHHEKFLLWSNIIHQSLTNANKGYPTIEFNLNNCSELVFAMENTPAIDNGNNLIGKDKRGERTMKLNREEAPDSTDALDQIVHGLFKKRLTNRGYNYILPINH